MDFSDFFGNFTRMAAQNITVDQLKALLTTDQQAKKADADVANDLKQVVLTEELTRPVIDSLAPLIPARSPWNKSMCLRSKAQFCRRPPRTFRPRPPGCGDTEGTARQGRGLRQQDICSVAHGDRDQDHHPLPGYRCGHASLPGQARRTDHRPQNGLANQTIHAINAVPATINIHNGIEDNPCSRTRLPGDRTAISRCLGKVRY